jgi:hypothetical protein
VDRLVAINIAVIAAALSCGALPTTQVVTEDEPHPARELGAIAATSKPASSSPPVPPTYPKQRSTTVANGQQR